MAGLKSLEIAFTLISLYLHCGTIEGYKILVTGSQVPSQIGKQVAIAEELINRGHEVHMTIASRYPKIDDLKKKGIKLLIFHLPDDVMYFGTKDMHEMTSNAFYNQSDTNVVGMTVKRVPHMTNSHCLHMMKDEKFITTAKSLKFDIAIAQTFILGVCPLILPKRLGIPFIQLTSFLFPWDIRIPALPSSIITPTVWSMEDLNSLSNRIYNLLLYIGIQFSFLYQIDTGLLREHTPGVGSWEELEREAELVIIDNNHMLDDFLPVPPHVITVPGLTAKPSKPLTGELDDIVSKSQHGVILMTLGSVVGNMPESVIIRFFQAFSKLKQTVIVKSDAPSGIEIPYNVKLYSWLPQNDILGHPKTKLFITHCGNHGQYESIYQGVPMLGFPIFAEQQGNCLRAKRKGYGLCLDIKTFTPEQLYGTIMEMLNNERFIKETKKASAIIRSEPMSSREKAAFWVEHVIKFGSSHLKSTATLNMPLYQYFMLDILLILILSIALIITVTIKMLKFITRKCIKGPQMHATDKLKLN